MPKWSSSSGPAAASSSTSMNKLKTSTTSTSSADAAAGSTSQGSGFLGDLSQRQEQGLQEFKKAIEQEHLLAQNDSLGTDDVTLLRFLRARSFHVSKSLAMFRACQKWRADAYQGRSIDQLYDEIDPFDFEKKAELFEYWPMCFHGVDKWDRPINYQKFGSISTKGLYSAATPEYHWKTVLVNCEALPREVLPAVSQEKGRVVDNAYCIVDLQGLSLSQFWDMKELAKGAFWVSQNIYPETMGRVSIINAPATFTTIWKAIKGWLSQQTQDKIEILGADYKHTLLEAVEAEQLPAELGGSCRCPEGCMMSSKGPWRHIRNREAAKPRLTKQEFGSAAAASPIPTESSRDPPTTTTTDGVPTTAGAEADHASSSPGPTATAPPPPLVTPFYDPGEPDLKQLEAARNDDEAVHDRDQ